MARRYLLVPRSGDEARDRKIVEDSPSRDMRHSRVAAAAPMSGGRTLGALGGGIDGYEAL